MTSSHGAKTWYCLTCGTANLPSETTCKECNGRRKSMGLTSHASSASQSSASRPSPKRITVYEDATARTLTVIGKILIGISFVAMIGGFVGFGNMFAAIDHYRGSASFNVWAAFGGGLVGLVALGVPGLLLLGLGELILHAQYSSEYAKATYESLNKDNTL